MQKLYFKTLSPVSITTGEKFSPYSDFVIDDKVYFLHQERIKDAFKQSPQMDSLIDEYVAGIVSRMDNNRSVFELKNFLSNRLKINFKEYALRAIPKSKSVGNKDKIQITEIIKSPYFQPYIPGSSLKGAFKGALLYKWLIDSPEGKKWIDEIYKISKLPKEDKNTKEAKKDIEKQLTSRYESYEIALSDSTPMNTTDIKIYKIIRYHLKNSQKQASLPQFVEAITPETCFETEFRPKEISWETLQKALIQYNQDANERDIRLAENFNVDTKLLDHYHQFAEKIKEGMCIFKIGSGKGYFFQSVGLAVFKQKGKEAFQTFLEAYPPSSKKSNANSFPITKVVDADTLTPWGWVQVDTKVIDTNKKAEEKPIEISTPAAKEPEKPKEIVAEYLKTGMKIKQNTEIDAVVVQSGKPNKVKLMIAPDNEPIFELRGYSSEIPEGTILICRVAQINNKGKILDVSFSKLKN
ncbi:MAG: hypothetical protein OHK0045_25700 [Raineya sp.]